ncbi:MAG TPA: FixH family protein [Candidatus Saccharimonadales bacterium]|nr:FixH family protein [Candidatus Saccharimonadales bacterium]
MRPEKLWPAAIVAVLLLVLAANVYVYHLATGKGAAVVEKDYYRRGVDWDSTVAHERASAALAWQLYWEVSPVDADGGADLRVRLGDRSGRPLAGARVHVAAVNNLEAGAAREADLAAGLPGEYSARLPLGRTGLWEFRFDATRGRDHFTAVERRDVMEAPRP